MPNNMIKSPSLVFRDNLTEVEQLMLIHQRLTGTSSGRRHQVEVLNKSAILFMCASFEAFVETLADSAFSQIAVAAQDPSKLPKRVLKAIAAKIKEDSNEIRAWDLAGDGWKAVCQQYKTSIVKKYTGPFNTPKPHNIDALFRDLIGLEDLSSGWRWKGMGSAAASMKLKDFVELRGALAHGEAPKRKVVKADVEKYLRFLAPLSVRSSNQVADYCQQVTGAAPWLNARYQTIR